MLKGHTLDYPAIEPPSDVGIAASIAKRPELLRQRSNSLVLSAPSLTGRDTLVHARRLTEDPVRAPVLAPTFARPRGKSRRRSTQQAEYNGGKD